MDMVKFYWSIFLRRLPYFLIVAILIGAVSVIVARSLPPSFVSQMRLIVESPQIPTELAASTVRTPAEEQLEIIEQRLMTRANLIDVANRLTVFENQDEMSVDRIVEAMKARTNIETASRRDAAALMTISFEARSGELAAAVLNEYLTSIQQEDVKSRTVRAGQTLEFFEQDVERLSEELAKRSARILAFKSENSEALPESLEYRLNQQTLLQERLAQQEREIANLDEQRNRLIQIFEATGQVAGVTGPALTPEQQQLEALRTELNDALVVYSSENPRVKMLEARIAQLEKTVSAQPMPETDSSSTGNSLLDVQLAELATRRAVLEEQRAETAVQLEKLNETIARTPTIAIQLDELELDYENIQQQYNTAVDRLSQASTGERIEVMARGQRISVIEPPAVPLEPSKPNRTLIAGGGGVFGILAGFGLIALLEFLNRSIRRPEELATKLGVTPLATIPYIETRGQIRRRRILRVLMVLVTLIVIPAAIYAVHTYYQPLDLIAERIMDRIGLRW